MVRNSSYGTGIRGFFAAVHGQDLAGEEGRLVGTEKDDCLGQFFGSAETFHRNAVSHFMYGVLAGDIHGGACGSPLPERGGDIDDAAVTLGEHYPHFVFEAQERAEDI